MFDKFFKKCLGFTLNKEKKMLLSTDLQCICLQIWDPHMNLDRLTPRSWTPFLLGTAELRDKVDKNIIFIPFTIRYCLKVRSNSLVRELRLFMPICQQNLRHCATSLQPVISSPAHNLANLLNALHISSWGLSTIQASKTHSSISADTTFDENINRFYCVNNWGYRIYCTVNWIKIIMIIFQWEKHCRICNFNFRKILKLFNMRHENYV